MSSSVIVDTARAMMNILHPMTGDTRAIRTLTVTAAPAVTFLLKANAWLFPAVNGRERPDLLFKTQTNPGRPDGAWEITDAGVAVLVISNLGGIRHNVPVATSFKFDFPSDDIVTMVVATADQEATDPPANCAIQDMSIYEQTEPQFFVDLRRSAIKQFPAVIIAFDSMLPSDGSTVSTLARSAKVGTRSSLYRINYQLNTFSSRGEGDSIRRVEGLSIADEIMRRLTDRRATDDGDCLSNPGGVHILNLFRNSEAQQNFQKYYIYTLLVAATVSFETIDERTFSPWLKAILNVSKPQEIPLPNQGDLPLVVDNEIDMS